MFSFDKITHKKNIVQRVLSQRQSVILSFTLDGQDVLIPRCKTALPDEWGIRKCCCCSICNSVTADDVKDVVQFICEVAMQWQRGAQTDIFDS